MCMMCDWGLEEPVGEAGVEDPAAAEARRRASQESWNRLMDEIARADAVRAATAAGALEPDPGAAG